jgi:hypothetical protein
MLGERLGASKHAAARGPARRAPAGTVPRVPLDARTPIRLALLRAGRWLRPRQLANLRSVLSYLELGAGLDSRPHVVADDLALFDVALRRLDAKRPLYLEFGVYEGRSLRWWAEHLDNPDARFVGFDSFEGLPEDWRPGLGTGHFKTGSPPRIDDDRVSFVVGWFDQTLPTFEMPDHDQLVVNIDCDLYASADTVLRWLEPHLRPGTLLYFDEFPDRDHEMRAFLEFQARSAHRCVPVAIGRGGMHWLFEVVEPLAGSPQPADPSP